MITIQGIIERSLNAIEIQIQGDSRHFMFLFHAISLYFNRFFVVIFKEADGTRSSN